jgi:hypothetical protein
LRWIRECPPNNSLKVTMSIPKVEKGGDDPPRSET